MKGLTMLEVTSASNASLGSMDTSGLHAPSPEDAAKAFESLFASILLKEMRNSLSEGFFGSEKSDVLGGMFDQYMGQAMTEGQGIGIRQMVLKHSQLNQLTPESR